MSKDNPFKIVLEYDMWDSFKVKKYRKWIQKRIDNGHPIPAIVLKRFLAIFKTQEELGKVKTELIKNITSNILNKFDKYKYTFKKERTWPKGRPVNLLNENVSDYMSEYSFENMIRKALWALVNMEGKEIYKTKEEFIWECVKSFNQYQKEKSIPNKILTDYKKHAVSAYMSIEIGFGTTKDKDLSATHLRNRGRNAIMSYEKQQKKKLR